MLLIIAFHRIIQYKNARNSRSHSNAERNVPYIYLIEQSKTVFITTHNPLVLDGLDLSNDDIRLFTLNRSRKNGNVYIERIQISSELVKEKMSLSQLWTSGRIGGVPELI